MEPSSETRPEGVPPEPATDADKGGGRKRRRWPWILGLLFLVFVLGVVFLGPLIVGPVVESVLVGAGADQGFNVAVSSCSFGWLSGLEIQGITARENIPFGHLIKVESVVVAPRWRGLLGGTLALGRFSILRPHIVIDPARKPPKKPKQEAQTRPEEKPAETSEGGGMSNLDLPLNLVGGLVEVLAFEDRPGFRLENLSVYGHLYGGEGRMEGTVQGDLVTGIRRDPLRLSGDIILGGPDTKPRGSAYLQVGGMDLSCLAPMFHREGAPRLDQGWICITGAILAEGSVLNLVSEMRIVNLRLSNPGGAPRIWESPEVTLNLEGVYEPDASRVSLRKCSLVGAPLDLDVSGVVGLPRGRPTDLDLRPHGDLRRLHGLVPGAERFLGTLAGAFKVTLVDQDLVVRGGLDLTDLLLRIPPDEKDPGGQEKTVREARARVDVDLTVQGIEAERRAIEGTVKVKGTSLGLDARIRSENLPEMEVTGTLNGDTARLLAQADVALPAGLQATGGVDVKYTAVWKSVAGRKPELKGSFDVSGPGVRRTGIEVSGLRITGNLAGDAVRFTQLRADVNGGTVMVRGDMNMAEADGTFSLALDASGIQVTQYVASFLRFVVPLYHIPEGLDGQVGGALSGSFQVAGPFPPAADGDLKALRGKGSIRIDSGFAEGSPLVGQILAGLGKRTRYEFKDLKTDFRLENSTVFHDSFTARGRELAWGFKGTTKLDTTIDYRLDPGPLLERFYQKRASKKKKVKAWERALRDLAGGLKDLPVSLGGTLDAPRLKLLEGALPGKGKDPVNNFLKGLLGGKKKK